MFCAFQKHSITILKVLHNKIWFVFPTSMVYTGFFATYHMLFRLYNHYISDLTYYVLIHLASITCINTLKSPVWFETPPQASLSLRKSFIHFSRQTLHGYYKNSRFRLKMVSGVWHYLDKRRKPPKPWHCLTHWTLYELLAPPVKQAEWEKFAILNFISFHCVTSWGKKFKKL